jgi:hypothetical protein
VVPKPARLSEFDTASTRSAFLEGRNGIIAQGEGKRCIQRTHHSDKACARRFTSVPEGVYTQDELDQFKADEDELSMSAEEFKKLNYLRRSLSFVSQIP